MTRRLLALATYDQVIASTRFRLSQMIPYLERAGMEVDFEPFLDAPAIAALYGPSRAAKARAVAAASARHLTLAGRLHRYDGVFVQRGAALIGPPVIAALARLGRRLPLAFDFDDAVWGIDTAQSKNPVAAKLLKAPGKVYWLRRHADLVFAGSSYLARWAGGESERVKVLPTVVSRDVWRPKPGRLEAGARARAGGPITLGWIGSHSTADQLTLVAPALRQLRAEGHDFILRVVGAAPDFTLPGIPMENVRWTLERELDDFRDLDIGLAPMRSGPLYEGKCGFKQIQYMAVGVPQVCSVVGGARDFVVDGENALVAHTAKDWVRHLRLLLTDAEAGARIARAGRELVETRLSAEVQGPRLAAHVGAMLGRAPRPEEARRAGA